MKIVIFSLKTTNIVKEDVILTNKSDIVVNNDNLHIFLDPCPLLEAKTAKSLKLYLHHNFDLRHIVELHSEAFKKYNTTTIFSVIITHYNRPHQIAKTLESLRKQTFAFFEVIFVDDGSDNKVCNCAFEKYKDLNIRKYGSNVNKGTYHCRNIGLDNAKGLFVNILDIGDEFDINKLASELNIFMRTDAKVVNSRYKKNTNVKFGNSIITYDREFIKKNIGYYDVVRYGADSEFFHRINKHYPEVIQKYGKITYFYEDHEDALTKKYGADFRDKYRQEFEKSNKAYLDKTYDERNRPFKCHFTQLPSVKPIETTVKDFSINTKKVGIFQISNIAKGLYRDGIAFSQAFNNLGINPYVFFYKDWKKITDIHSDVPNVQGKLLNHSLRDNNIFLPTDNYDHKTIKEFVQHVDLVVIIEIGLFELVHDILEMDKKVIFMVNPDCAISLNKMNTEEYVEKLQEFTDNPNFRVLSRTNTTKRILKENGVPSSYIPFTVNDRIYTIKKHKAKQEVTYLMNVGTCGAENRKCVDECVAVFNKVCARIPNVKFIVKTVVDIFAKFGVVIEEEYKDRITIINEYYTPKQMENLHKEIDGIIYISKYDGLGLALLETMHQHKPLIVNKTELSNELLHAYDKAMFVKSRPVSKWRLADCEEIDFGDLEEKIIEMTGLLTSDDLETKTFNNETCLLREQLFAIAMEKLMQTMFYDVDSYNSKVVGHMATFEKRHNVVFDTMMTILPQVDQLRVGLNDYKELKYHFPLFTGLDFCDIKIMEADYRAMTKFLLIEDTHLPAYVFTFDDDLFYPKDYVSHYITKLREYNNSCVISLCGRLYNSYPKDRFDAKNYGFREVREGDHFVHNVGTGVQAFHSSAVPNLKEFLWMVHHSDLIHYSCDEFWAKYLVGHGIFCVCIGNSDKMWVKINRKMKEGLHEIKLKDEELSKKIVDNVQMVWDDYDERFLL